MAAIKDAGKRLVNSAGYAIHKLQPPASHLRPIGDQDSAFADFKARGAHRLGDRVNAARHGFSRALRGPENQWHVRAR